MIVSRANIDALTGLRFVAAFTIAFGHAYPHLLSLTGVGMPLFFTLSGFIIHYVYADPFATGWRRACGPRCATGAGVSGPTGSSASSAGGRAPTARWS